MHVPAVPVVPNVNQDFVQKFKRSRVQAQTELVPAVPNVPVVPVFHEELELVPIVPAVPVVP
jgi:hypothetical protein